MSVNGYSPKPLLEKLGYKLGESVCVLDVPDWFTQELGQNGIATSDTMPATWAHCFFTAQSQLAIFCEQFHLEQIEKALWVSWPKKSSGVETDLTEQTFRDFILPLGWVDTKVVAVDDTWSGLKFLRRKP